ncbi:MAG: tetratricopeptide repeat protein [Sterolibacterium sp.]|nr:tetratricopeptide repeat protein [Sterolibacterium sp.]
MKTRLAAIIIGILSLSLSAAQAADDLSKLSIDKEPAKLIAGIYQAFHDWRVDAGIALTTRALADLDGDLKKNPEMEIADANLKTKKVKQVASALHTLLGMLDQRKALKLLDDASQRKAKRMEELAGSHGKIETADIERQLLVEKESAQLSAAAVKEFRKAIEIDPANPSPHFELAKLYAQGLPGSGTAEAEEEYYRAAVCALDEGDITAANSTMRTLATLNPKSKYLAQFDGRTHSGSKGK